MIKTTFAKAMLATVLCVAALGGVTAVVFLGDVSDDGTIGIVATAGEIKVDIVDSISGESLIGKVLDFVVPTGETHAVFGPGTVYHTTGFCVKNIGGIPINFRVSVSDDERIDMQEFEAAFEVWISNSTTFDDTAERLTEFKFVGPLYQGDTSKDTFYLFVKMKDDASNAFQGKAYSGIGVTVYAVQGNAAPGK